MIKRYFCIVFTLFLLGVPKTFCGDKSISLNGVWSLDAWEQGKKAVRGPEEMAGIVYERLEAHVPGNVELDLYRAGRIENPETGCNVYRLRYLEGYQWRYVRTFPTPDIPQGNSVFIRFEGIDCYADIWLNGRYAGAADNMLIEHEYEITEWLAPAGEDNLLEVYIRSSVIEARKDIPPVLSNNWDRPETVTTRRAPHTYGWDIMPRLVSAGLWRGVFLDIHPEVYLRDVHWMTTQIDTTAKKAKLLMDCTVSLPPRCQSKGLVRTVRLSRNGQTIWERSEKIAMFSQRVKIQLDNVEFWWPRGYGNAALYDAEVIIADADGSVLDKDSRQIGIRTVQLLRSDIHTDNEPGAFCFLVNQEPIFIHGSNWTPLDALHSRDTEHLEKAFALAVDLNCNMLRCWGGNVYEDHEFYNLCDRNGILVWQDFAMGCSYYPQTQWFQDVLEKEVESFVRKVRNHPSIALWAGNNENDEMMCDGNFAFFKPDPAMDKVSRFTLPHLLFELDPTRPYLPSSPYWSERFCREYYGNTDALPERHLWGPRGYYKDAFYTDDARCIFASETGYHGMPCLNSLQKMFTPAHVYPWTDKKHFKWNEEWIAKAVTEYEEYGYRPERNNLMINQVKAVFGNIPTDLNTFISASQSVQAEAMKFFVERFRGRKFAPCTGILWWNIRDGWPIISDAVVDWYFQPKMAYWFLRNVQRDVCAMILDASSEGYHPLVVVNDSRKARSGKIKVCDIDSGKVLYEGTFSVAANGRTVLLTGIDIPEGQGMLKILYQAEGDEQHVNHYLYGQPPFRFEDYRNWLKKACPEGLAL